MKQKIAKELFLELFLISCGVSAIALFYKRNVLLFFVLMLVSIACVSIWRKKEDLMFYSLAAFIGPMSEIICIRFGAWQYSNPTFLGIPAWLPLVWGVSFLIIRRISETLSGS